MGNLGRVCLDEWVYRYADIRSKAKSWEATLLSEKRSDYGWQYGIHALREDEDLLCEQVNAELPKRMLAVSARAKVRSIRRAWPAEEEPCENQQLSFHY